MEALYQYAWKYGLYPRRGHMADGRGYCVRSGGRLNTASGPDFTGARIEIDGISWAGDVEIHVKASDWHAHGHDTDPAYGNVITHAVAVDDCRIRRPDGTEIAQMVFDLPADVGLTYERLIGGLKGVRCRDDIRELWPLPVQAWLERMGVERLQSKAARVAEIYNESGHDWARTLFVVLARALGFGVNSDAMEMVARSLPMNFMGRHTDHPQQIEAMLLGQAGLLNEQPNIFDEYYQQLDREYSFLSHKYGLRPLRTTIWRFAGTRPQNYPHRRLAYLAAWLCTRRDPMKDIFDCGTDPERLAHLFLSVSMSEYWQTRYRFSDLAGAKTLNGLSYSSAMLIIINAVAPVIFAFGTLRERDDALQHAIDLLDNIPAERNAIIRDWKMTGLEADSAFRTQALLHLRREYCDRLRCAECGIGYSVIRSRMQPDVPERLKQHPTDLLADTD